MRSLFKIFLIAAAFVFAVSCDAPRDNPVDPYNPDYKLGTLDGYVRASTGQFLNNVQVLWKNSSTVTRTDTSGYYKISGLSTQDGWIYYEKEGLGKDSQYVNWNNQKSKRVPEKSLYFTIGEINGNVYNSAGQPVNGVKVIWKNQNILAQTNAQGYFRMQNVAIKNGNLYFEKSGFADDSTFINWNGEVTISNLRKDIKETIGRISGKVVNFQSQPVEGVTVLWKNQNIVATTDAQGNFEMSSVAIADGMLYYSKSGFAFDSTQVKWSSGQTNYNIDRKTLSYTIGQIDGYVKTLALPRKGIAGTEVFWKNTSTLIQTDASGHYLLAGIPMQNGYVYFDKDGYSSDSAYVTWGTQNSIRLEDVSLNAVPKLNSVSATTTATYKLGLTDPNYKFFVQAFITDDDLDVDTVYIKNSELGFTGTLIYNITSKAYEKTFYPYNLNLTAQTFGDIVGKPLSIVVKSTPINNSPGKLFQIGSATIKRIINQEIEILSPKNIQVVGSLPLLEWTRFKPGFNFTYSIEIGTDDVARTVVWSKSGISQDKINIQVDTEISQGQYYWIISCVDEYGNRSDSKAGIFIVQ